MRIQTLTLLTDRFRITDSHRSGAYVYHTLIDLTPTDRAPTCAVVIAASNAANAYVMRYRAVAEYHYRRESDDLCRAAGTHALRIIFATRSSLARSHVT